MKRFLWALFALSFIGAVSAAEINDLNVTDASNTARFPENMAPSAVNNGARALEGLIARWHNDINCSTASTGSSNAYVFSANQTLSAYYDGLTICFDANFGNTGAATLNVDSVGADSIVWPDGTALASGDIPANAKVVVVHDGTNWQLETLSVAPGALHGNDTIDGTEIVIGSDAQGDVLYYNGSAWARLGAGTSGQFLQTQGAGANPQWADVTPSDLDTPVTLSTQTEVDFTGISSDAKKITVTFSGASTAGAGGNGFEIVLGDSGGFEATGYSGRVGTVALGTTAYGGSGYAVVRPLNWNVADTFSGSVILTLADSGNNTWVAQGAGGEDQTYITGGTKSLSATLTQVRVNALDSDTFDAGTLNILVEY